MKTNKKAILGFAVAMIFSLALMQGLSTKTSQQDLALQQISLGTSYAAGATENESWSNVWERASDISQTICEWSTVLALGTLVVPEPVVSKGASAAAWITAGVSGL